MTDEFDNIELTESDNLQLNNFSSAVSLSDAIMVLENIVGLQNFNAEQDAIADTNNDGSVSLSDAIVILEQIVGLSSTPAPRVVADNYFTTKKFFFEAIEEQEESVDFEIVLDFAKLANEFESEINGFTLTIVNSQTTDEVFNSSSDDILFQSSEGGQFALVLDRTGNTNLASLGKQSTFSTSILKDASGLSSLNANLEISFVGSQTEVEQEFLFFFDEGNYIDGAINLAGAQSEYLCFMPGDVNGSLDDITVYELI